MSATLRSNLLRIASELPAGDPTRKQLLAALKEARTLTLTFHEDAGHGWLEVPIEFIKELGVEKDITPYSMMRRGKAYLEEDMDAGTFLDAAKKAGYSVNIKRKYTDHSPIRNYPSFRMASTKVASRTGHEILDAILGHRAFEKIFSDVSKTDKQAADLLYEVHRKLEDALGISENEMRALMRVKDLIDNPGWAPALQRNNIATPWDAASGRML